MKFRINISQESYSSNITCFQNIRNEVFSQAGVSNIDELRQLSTGTLRKSWIAAKGNLEWVFKIWIMVNFDKRDTLAWAMQKMSIWDQIYT